MLILGSSSVSRLSTRSERKRAIAALSDVIVLVSTSSARISTAAVYFDAHHIDEGTTFLKQRAQPHA